VAQNVELAFKWSQKAAHQGVTAAACATGVMLLKGIGVPKDLKAALHWLLKAAEQGDALAQWSLSTAYISGGDGVSSDLKEAFVWCQRAADQGFVPALSNLGLLFAVTKNPAKAADLWLKASEQGDPEACYNLALAFLKGEGVAQDKARAFDLLIEAARQGVIPAQSRIGLMYAKGEGVPQDSVEAHKWFYLAATGGDDAAQSNLQRSLGVCSQPQVEEALRRASKTMP
jgi:TPR repeat protein